MWLLIIFLIFALYAKINYAIQSATVVKMGFDFRGLVAVRSFLRKPGTVYKPISRETTCLVARSDVGFGFLLSLVSPDASRSSIEPAFFF
jgi:hypothetical protein